MTQHAETTAAEGFAALLRTATAKEHQQAEQSSFMGDLLGGKLGVEAYAELAGQLWFVYRELERAGLTLADHPVVGRFIDPALHRTAALETDLRHLRGEDWRRRAVALPATEAYAARLREVAAEWPDGFIAHHYTRYLGDLSGGQVIRGTAAKLWNLPKRGDGVLFYVFDRIANPAAFKREYRALLDALPVDELEQQRVLGEAQRAFDLNTAMFRELGTEFPVRRHG